MKIKIPRRALVVLAFGIPEVLTIAREGFAEARDEESEGGEKVTVAEISEVLKEALTETGLIKQVATIIWEANN